jgi:hypothetical protein
MLLSGAPLSKLIRLWVWLCIQEKLIEPRALKTSPENLVSQLPLLNSLLIFYLGPDFESKVKDLALAIR